MEPNTKDRMYFKEFTKGIIRENPVFRLALGMCASLAVSTSATSALGMGLATVFVLVLSNISVSLFRKLISDKVRLPAYIVIIATFTTIVEMLLKAYIPVLGDSLGVYLPLIAVNCIIMGRAEAFASKNNVVLSFLDGLGMGIGFTGALVVVGVVRELLGGGTLFGYSADLPNTISFLTIPAGGFFVLGILIWFTTFIHNKLRKDDSRKRISAQVCAACPQAESCNILEEKSAEIKGENDNE